MIEVTVQKHEIRISGHAHYAEKGKDIVCAAVSALEYTLTKALEVIAGENLRYEEKEGQVTIGFGELSEKGQAIVDTFFVGILGVIESYPQYVRLTP